MTAVLSFVAFLPIISYANRFTHSDEVSIDEALNIAVAFMSDRGGLEEEYIRDNFEYSATLEDYDNQAYWYISLWPKLNNVLSYRLIICADGGSVSWHISDRYFFHYQLYIDGESFTDWFNQVLSKQEEKYGPQETWNYNQFAETEELAHGWMYSGVYERFLFPQDDDMNYTEAVTILQDYLGQEAQIEILSNCFECYQLWQRSEKSWEFVIRSNDLMRYLEIDADTGSIVYDYVLASPLEDVVTE